MAGELIWSRTALDDIDAVAAWVARDSRTHARRLVEHVFACGEALASEPGRPRLLLELDGVRLLGLPIEGFRILYERQGEDIHVLGLVYREGTEPD